MSKKITIIGINYFPEDSAIGLYTTQKAEYLVENGFDVTVITQNVDDLHERAGSSKLLHVHGELRKVRSTIDPDLIYTLDGWELKIGDKCEKGSQLRPHIVWFGEAVPFYELALQLVEVADYVIIIGTSMQVYPAASLIQYAPQVASIYFVDPNPSISPTSRIKIFAEKATIGVPMAIAALKHWKDE